MGHHPQVIYEEVYNGKEGWGKDRERKVGERIGKEKVGEGQRKKGWGKDRKRKVGRKTEKEG